MKKFNLPLDLTVTKTDIITTGFAENFEIIPGDLSSEIARTIESSCEFKTYATIFKEISPTICLDIGSNIGAHALFFAKYFKQVYAFEPNPFIYSILQRNIERNKANILAYPFGLSDSAKELTLHINCDGNSGNSSFYADNTSKNSQSVLTHVAIGDEVLAKEEVQLVDFIKIDTEGHEANVLLGLKKCINQNKPVIALEWNYSSTKKLFIEHDLFKTFFSDYLWFGFGWQYHFNKGLCSTLASKIKRKILKNILGPVNINLLNLYLSHAIICA